MKKSYYWNYCWKQVSRIVKAAFVFNGWYVCMGVKWIRFI